MACAACAGLAALPAAAQNAGGLRITPVLDTTLSVVRSTLPVLQGQGDDVVLQVRPGVQITAGSGRVRGTLDYALNAIQHSQSAPGQGQGDSLQNNLNAALNAEVLERWVYVDANASITQQAISAYGQQSVDGAQINTNRTEVSRLSVKPYARGKLADWAVYQVGFSADVSHSRGTAVPDSHGTGVNLSLGSPSGGTLLGWSALATQQRTTFSGRASDNGRLSVSLLVRPAPEWNGALRGGQETTSVGSFYRRTYNNWGGDLRWTPSVRTTASVSADRRYFGDGYQVLLEHRFASSSIRFSSNRDANNTANGAGVGQPITLYQLLFAQLASAYPDPALRDQVVRDTLRTLQLDPNAVVGGGFASGGTTVQRRDDLSMTYVGRRTTFTLQAFSSDTRRIDTTTAAVDTTPVRQAGLNATASYRLTPTSNLNLTGSGLRTRGTATQAGNQLKSVALTWGTQLSPYLSTRLGARYSAFDGAANPYRESALSASLNLRF